MYLYNLSRRYVDLFGFLSPLPRARNGMDRGMDRGMDGWIGSKVEVLLVEYSTIYIHLPLPITLDLKKLTLLR